MPKQVHSSAMTVFRWLYLLVVILISVATVYAWLVLPWWANLLIGVGFTVWPITLQALNARRHRKGHSPL